MPSIFTSLRNDLYIPIFHEVGEPYFHFLTSSSVAKMAFLSAYKTLTPIEKITRKERWELYRYVIEAFPTYERMDKMDAARIIYTIGNLL